MKLLKNDGTPIFLKTTLISDTSKLPHKGSHLASIRSGFPASTDGFASGESGRVQNRGRYDPTAQISITSTANRIMFVCQSNPGLSCSPSCYGLLQIFVTCCCTWTLIHLKQLLRIAQVIAIERPGMLQHHWNSMKKNITGIPPDAKSAMLTSSVVARL